MTVLDGRSVLDFARCICFGPRDDPNVPTSCLLYGGGIAYSSSLA